MASGEFSNSNQPHRVDADAQRQSRLDPSILDQVLQETLAGGEDQLRPEELQALRDVAKRHQGSLLILDPVAVDLVEALLRLRFPGYRVEEPAWRNMSRDIAQSLLESPASQQRLSGLWERLSEAAS